MAKAIRNHSAASLVKSNGDIFLIPLCVSFVGQQVRVLGGAAAGLGAGRSARADSSGGEVRPQERVCVQHLRHQLGPILSGKCSLEAEEASAHPANPGGKSALFMTLMRVFMHLLLFRDFRFFRPLFTRS